METSCKESKQRQIKKGNTKKKKKKKKKNSLFVVISSGDVITAHDQRFSLTPLSFPFQKIHLLQKLLLMILKLPHLSLSLSLSLPSLSLALALAEQLLDSALFLRLFLSVYNLLRLLELSTLFISRNAPLRERERALHFIYFPKCPSERERALHFIYFFEQTLGSLGTRTNVSMSILLHMLLIQTTINKSVTVRFGSSSILFNCSVRFKLQSF